MSHRSSINFCWQETAAREGMVSATHPLISEVGVQILRKGGNAMDAAVAAAITASVVEPYMSGLGGAGGLLYFDTHSNDVFAIDYGASAPMSATPDLYDVLEDSRLRDGLAGHFGWPKVKGDHNSIGYKSIATPGFVSGIATAHARHGSMLFEDLFEPAFRLSEYGFDVDWFLASMVSYTYKQLRLYPCTARIFMPHGCPPRPEVQGKPDKLQQPDLFRTLELLSEKGCEEYYSGSLANEIVDYVAANGGLLTTRDLASYQPMCCEKPLIGGYREYTVVTLPGVTGGPSVVQALRILENYDLKAINYGSRRHQRILIEVFKRVFNARLKLIGDICSVDKVWERLLSDDYSEMCSKQVAAQLKRTKIPSIEKKGYGSSGCGCTTHLTVVDKHRNIACMTNTLGDIFGSKVVVPGTGILMNNLMVSFDPRGGSPNLINAGKKPLSNISPVLLFKEGKPILAVGASGGRRIITAVTQVISNIVDFSMGVQDAISAPRIHCEGEGEISIDGRLPLETLAYLSRVYKNVTIRQDTPWAWHFACPNGIMLDWNSGMLCGGVHPSRMALVSGM